jgi:Uma2 family endonuclease
MNLIPQVVPLGTIIYPESDGQPLADNTLQLRWIVTLYGNLAAVYRDNPEVFVGADQFWYPVEDDPTLRVAPDVYVVFGRPKGERSSYRQWEEGNIPMTVVFEVLSPSNTWKEMDDKYLFYEEHGVEEYYIYDPDHPRLNIYLRRGEVFRRVRPVDGFVSPRLGIRFDLSGQEMVVYGPDGRRFLAFEEVQAERERERQQRLQAEQRAAVAEQRAGDAERRADDAERRVGDAERRAARVIELGRKARLGQASAAELQELEHLEQESLPPT